MQDKKDLTRSGFTLVELLVVIAVIGILIALLIPAVQSVRGAARRLQCANNVRQLGIALHNFESTNHVFPASGWTRPGPGNPEGRFVGWRPLVLPFMEQTQLHSIYDFSLNWWEGGNAAAAAVPVPGFVCPSTPARTEVFSAIEKPPRPPVVFQNPVAPTDYEALMGVKPDSINPHLPAPLYSTANRFSVIHRNSRTSFSAIRDGTAATIMVVECAGRPDVYRGNRIDNRFGNDQGIGWADSEGPFSFDGSNRDGSIEGGGPAEECRFVMNRRNDNEPYSFHPGGGNFLYADAHVSFLDQGIDIVTFAALATRAGGETVLEY